MAAVGNLPANGTLLTDAPRTVKNVAKKSTAKPVRMMNGEKTTVAVSESGEKVTSSVMNGQTKHLTTDERKRTAEGVDLADDLGPSKVTKLEVKALTENSLKKDDSKSDKDEDIESAVNAIVSAGDAEVKIDQNGDVSENDVWKKEEKPSHGDVGEDEENGISAGSQDDKDAAAAAEDDEESEAVQLLADSGDEENNLEVDDALLLSDDEKKDSQVDEAIETKNNNNKSDDKGATDEKDCVRTVDLDQSDCSEEETKKENERKTETETDKQGKSEIESVSEETKIEASVSEGEELPLETDATGVNGVSGEDTEAVNEDGEILAESPKVSDKNTDSENTELKEKIGESESASDKDKDELRDIGDEEESANPDGSKTAGKDVADDRSTDELQMDISGESDCIISADKEEDCDQVAKTKKDTSSGVKSGEANGDAPDLIKDCEDVALDLDFEILSDDEDKDKNNTTAKRAASPDLSAGEVEPLAKKGRLASTECADDVTGQAEVDLDDVICEEGTVTLPVKVLEAFIHKRVQSYLANTHKSKLLKRVEELQLAVDKWRQVAKSLEKKVQEVTALRGGLRSNSKVSSRHMGIQCDVVKLQALAQQKQQVTQVSPAKVPSTPVTTATIVSSPAGTTFRPLAPNNITFIQTPSGAIMAPNNVQVVNQTSKTVRDLLEQQRQSHLVQVVNNPNTSQVRLPVSQTQPQPQPQQMVKGFIDLTDENPGEDKTIKTLQPGTVIITSPGTSVPGNSVVLQSVSQPIRPQNTVLVAGSSMPSAQLRGGQVIVQRSPTVTIAPSNTIRATLTTAAPIVPKHPAPLPAIPVQKQPTNIKKLPPPKPSLKISRVQQGIVLSWNMNLNAEYSDVSNYQLFAYQEQSGPVVSSLWKKVGDVRALPLPMACTLTQFQEGNKYHFAVRAVDTHARIGPFSLPNSIHLVANADS